MYNRKKNQFPFLLLCFRFLWLFFFRFLIPLGAAVDVVDEVEVVDVVDKVEVEGLIVVDLP